MKKIILFVCQGNSIRSIMAEAAFNHLCKKNYQAKSAGTLPIHHIDDKAKEVLKEANIPLIKKEPSSLNYKDIVSAEKLILMNDDLPNFPVMIPKKLITKWRIKEVVGRPIDEFRKTRDAIIDEVKKLIKKLK